MPAAAAGGVVDDAAYEQPVTLGQPDGAAQLGGEVRGSEGDAEPRPLVAATLAHRRDAVAQVVVGGAGEVEAVLDAVGVDADDLAGAVEHGSARRSRRRWRGVLECPDDAPPTWAAEPTIGAGDLAPGRPQSLAPGGDRDDDVALAAAAASAHCSGGAFAGVDVDDDEVAVDITAGRPWPGRCVRRRSAPTSCGRAGCGRW